MAATVQFRGLALEVFDFAGSGRPRRVSGVDNRTLAGLPGVPGVLDLCLMATAQVVTMSPKSSDPQGANSVSQVLMSDKSYKRQSRK